MTTVKTCLIGSCLYNEDLLCTKEEIIISTLGDCLMWVDLNWVSDSDKDELRKKYDRKEVDNLFLTHNKLGG